MMSLNLTSDIISLKRGSIFFNEKRQSRVFIIIKQDETFDGKTGASMKHFETPNCLMNDASINTDAHLSYISSKKVSQLQ
jgi:hypothetical protein